MKNFIIILYLILCIFFSNVSIIYAADFINETNEFELSGAGMAIEAETCAYNSDWVMVPDSDASGGFSLQSVTNAAGFNYNVYTVSEGSLKVRINAAQSGNYSIYFRILTQNRLTYFYRINEIGNFTYTTIPSDVFDNITDKYSWHLVTSYRFKQGENLIEFFPRHDFAIDKIIITNNAIDKPSGMGEVPQTFSFETPRDEVLYYSIPEITPTPQRPKLLINSENKNKIKNNLTHPKNEEVYNILLNNASKDYDCILDENNIIAFVSRNIGSGVIEQLRFNDDYYFYSINNKELKLYKGRETFYSYLKVGDEITYYTDIFDNIFYTEINKAINNHFLYIIKFGGNLVANEEEVYGKFYDINKGVVTYKVSKNVRINGNPHLTYFSLNNIIASLKIKDSDTGPIINQMIVAKFNDHDEIISIETAKPISTADETIDGFFEMYSLSELRFFRNSKSFDYKIYLESETSPVVLIPQDPSNANENEFKLINYSNFGNGSPYLVAAYCYGKEKEIPDVILCQPEGKTLSAEFPTSENIGVVKEIVTAAKEDGTIVKRFKVIKGNSEDYFDVDDETEFSSNGLNILDVEVGDVIRYTTESDKVIDRFEAYYDNSKNSMLVTYSILKVDVAVIKGIVKKISEKFITVNYNNDIYRFDFTQYLNESSITLVIPKNNKFVIREGHINDIEPDDEIILQLTGYRFRNLVILKR